MRHSILNLDMEHAKKYLQPGNVSPLHFNQLIFLSKIRGQKIILALGAFLVEGMTRKEIFDLYDISPGYFSLKLNQLRHCSRMILELFPYYDCSNVRNIGNDHKC